MKVDGDTLLIRYDSFLFFGLSVFLFPSKVSSVEIACC